MRYLAVFKGRSGCLKAQQSLSNHGVTARIVNTPRETGYGCGISLEIVAAAYGIAAGYVLEENDFKGWWVLEEVNGGTRCTKL